ncbi:hypothetical protein D3C87_1906200 [compost metagenome]
MTQTCRAYTRNTEGSHDNMSDLALVGASLLAMEVNDNAGHQTARVVHASFASGLASAGGWPGNKKGDRDNPVAFSGAVQALTALLPPGFH